MLPFENLSNNKEDASFADGVQDEILTKLAKIADSKGDQPHQRDAISRQAKHAPDRRCPSAFRMCWRAASARRSRLHINAQLIDTRTDTHIWAEQYDRDLKDMFAIQSEIAQKVAEQLHAKVSPAEKLAIERPPTADLTAFDLYSRAKNLLLACKLRMLAGGRICYKAADLLNQAVAHDPSFLRSILPARVRLTIAFTILAYDHTAARLALRGSGDPSGISPAPGCRRDTSGACRESLSRIPRLRRRSG